MHKSIGKGRTVIEVRSDYSFSTANCFQIAKDLRYLISQLRKHELEPSIKNLYARIAIVFLAFYFESLANSLFDQERSRKVWKAEMTKYDNDNSDGLPVPIRKVRAYYKKEFGKTLFIDIKGISDLFTIRNKIFAHAKERTTIGSSDISKITQLVYLKFKEFPNFYPEFTTEHFEKLFTEVRDFFQRYLDLVHDNIPPWLQRELQFTSLSE